MEMAINPTFCELSDFEMMYIEGGKWSWKEFGKSTVSGAVGGGITGACGGTVTIPGVGTVAGWAGGAILGGIGGAAAYAVCGWW